ncbi:MAG: protein kinase domain-containing protein, partial [Planctomycetota bacterium]
MSDGEEEPRFQCPKCGGPVPEDLPADSPCPLCIGKGPTAELLGDTPPHTVPSAPEEHRSFPPETNFGPYRIVGELGRGGMGVVYRAVEVALGREVALKVLLAGDRATPEQASRFLREARSAAVLSHPNIVPVFSAGTEKGVPYFAMEFIEGASLEEEAAEPLPVRKAVEIVRDVARALSYSHGKSIVHRDIKPANILLDIRRTPKVTDFGLAKVLGDQTGLTQEGTALGTPAYMSPEQATGKTGEIGPLSDQYSLGAVFYELLAGRPPFLAETPLHLMAMVQTEDPPPLLRLRSDVPREVQTLCLKPLEKEPARRYTDMTAMAEDLDRWLKGEPIQARPPSIAEKLKRWARRQKSALLAAALATILVGGASMAYAIVKERAERASSIPASPAPAPAISQEARQQASVQMDIGRGLLTRAEKSYLTENPASRRLLLEEALAAFREACKLDPDRAEAFLEAGKTLSFLEQYKEAIGAFDRALELNPDLTDAYYGRAQIRYKRYFQSRLLGGQAASDRIRARIEEDLDKIDKIGVKPEKYHCGRSVLLLLDGKDQEALRELDKAIEANESFADAYAARGSVFLLRGLSRGGPLDKMALRRALEEFTAASRLSGGATEHRASRAQVLLALGRKDEALEEANAVVEALPDKPFPYLLRAQIRRIMGDDAGYDEDMDRADALPIDNPDMHFTVAGALVGGAFQTGGLRNLRLKDVKRAIKHLDAILKQHPDRTDVRGIRGLALALTGRREEAITDLEAYL